MTSCVQLNNYISINTKDYDDCIDVIEHNHVIQGIKATVRLHYLKFDGNGLPMVKPLANMLYTYIINYCLSARNRNDTLTLQQAAVLTKEARKLFRHPIITDNSPDKTGEAGELLLYFLMEAVLKAPQVVAKMELKTNHKDEIKGSDGMHAKWNPEDDVVDFFFGESKLYQSSSDAISNAIESIDEFHNNKMYRHEFTMVTKHFKYADENTKNAISEILVHGEPGSDVRVNHACLIGYDFKKYKSLPLNKSKNEITADFCSQFLVDSARLVNLLQKSFDKFDKKHLKFDVFFVPFPSVVEFRNAFNDALD
jgi:hypothetical protein